MAFRRPAASRKATGWRRSGNESFWENSISEEELVSSPRHAQRPQSAIEGGHLDTWLEYLHTLQDKTGGLVYDPPFHGQTTSMPVLNKVPVRQAWRQMDIPSSSKDSSSCGSSNIYESSLGSQDSLQTDFFPVPERRGSWERAHITEAPKKEQPHLCQLTPVNIGWLPIQRRVMKPDDARGQNRNLDHPSGQVKLKQPLTPTMPKNQEPPYDEVERSPSGSRAGKNWWTSNRGSPAVKEVKDKTSSRDNEGSGALSWQALRRGWMAGRELVFPGSHNRNDSPAGSVTNIRNIRKSPLMDAVSPKPNNHVHLNRSLSADHHIHRTTPLQINPETFESYTPSQRSNALRPLKATVPLVQKDTSQTSSTSTTLIPQNKAGFSSITISSRKVSRSASLPGSDSGSPPGDQELMDPNRRQLKVQRKATIVKVTEQRIVSSPAPDTVSRSAPPSLVDTVVRRRKATIIKVTEHKEGYSPAKSGSRNPEYRHSYSDGVYQNNNPWELGNYSESHNRRSYHFSNSPAKPNAVTSHADKHPAVHRSTLSLYVSKPAVTAELVSSEVRPKASGRRSDTVARPLSCYGQSTGHSELSKESRGRWAGEEWSLGFPQRSQVKAVNVDSGLSSPESAIEDTELPIGDIFTPIQDERERPAPIVDGLEKESPSLTLIEASDPHSPECREEVLALNAAAIIANIKLQRQLSKKRKPDGDSEDSRASPQGNPEVTEERTAEPQYERAQVHQSEQPLTTYVPLRPGYGRSEEAVSPQQALQEHIRSLNRVREVKLDERKQLRSEVADRQMDAALRQKNCQSTSLNGNPFEPEEDFIYQNKPRPRYKK